MRRFAAVIVFLLVLPIFTPGQATRIDITQSGSPLGNCGTNVHSPSWFNTSGNWGTGAGQIGPGTVVHICGTITTTLAIQGNGSAGNPWTLYFEPGAKISHAYCGDDGGNGCLNISGHQYFVIDGGTACGWINNALVSCNGIIEATANGTGLANSNSTRPNAFGVFFDSSSNWEFRNIELRNIYVHTGNSDTGGGNSDCFSESNNATWTNIHIHNFIMHDCHWGFTADADPGPFSNLEVDHFYSYNMDHTFGMGMGNGVNNTFLIHDFHIGSVASWNVDCCGNPRHHDGIHFFGGSNGLTGGSYNGVKIWNGLFDGDWGTTNTANIFFENTIHAIIFNTVFFDSTSANPIHNGVINTCNEQAGSTTQFINNTVVWTHTYSDGYIAVICNSADFRNNVLIDQATTGGMSLVAEPSNGGTWDYNVYAAVSPGIGMFGNSSSCCTWNYSQWKTNRSADAHSPAIQSPPAGINTSSGAPNAGSIVIGAGTNLTSLGIPELARDRNGALRGASGPWDAGAFKYGAGANTPIANISSSPVAFGNQNVSSTSSSITTTISNVGSSALILANPTYYSLSGGNSGDFAVTAITCSAALSIAPSSSCTIGITFTPSAAGSRSTTLTISSNATAATASLTGTGVATSGTLSFSPTSGTFGTVTVGGNNSQTFTVSNIGTASVTMTTPHYTLSGTNAGEFSRTGGTCADGGTIGVSSSCTITIQFAPTSAGSKTASLQINAGAATASVSLTATGAAVVVVPPAPMLQIL